VISVALNTSRNKIGNPYIKRHFCTDPMTILVSYQARFFKVFYEPDSGHLNLK